MLVTNSSPAPGQQQPAQTGAAANSNFFTPQHSAVYDNGGSVREASGQYGDLQIKPRSQPMFAVPGHDAFGGGRHDFLPHHRSAPDMYQNLETNGAGGGGQLQYTDLGPEEENNPQQYAAMAPDPDRDDDHQAGQ